jgi:hypothetical protein
VRAAALVVGGRRYSEVLIHQQARTFLQQLASLGFDDLTPTDVWVALALFQTLLDPQDPHLHAPFLWRDRLALGGSGRRASVLLVEGVGDRFVPNHATETLGVAFGGVAMLGPGAHRCRVSRPRATLQESMPRPPGARAVDAAGIEGPRAARCSGLAGPLHRASRAQALSNRFPARSVLHFRAGSRRAGGRGSRSRTETGAMEGPIRDRGAVVCSRSTGRKRSTPWIARPSKRCWRVARRSRSVTKCARWS